MGTWAYIPQIRPEPPDFHSAHLPERSASLSVVEAKAKGPRAGVVVVGRVRELTKGFAAFTLTDASLKYCGEVGEGEKSDDNCPNPWDYCCHKSEEIAANTIAVAVTVKGEIVAVPGLPEIRNLDTVAVQGDLVKGADGSLSIDAKGWYRRGRPNLPATVQFPQ